MGGLVNGSPFLNTFSLDAKRDANAIGTIVAIYESKQFSGPSDSYILISEVGCRESSLYMRHLTFQVLSVHLLRPSMPRSSVVRRSFSSEGSS